MSDDKEELMVCPFCYDAFPIPVRELHEQLCKDRELSHQLTGMSGPKPPPKIAAALAVPAPIIKKSSKEGVYKADEVLCKRCGMWESYTKHQYDLPSDSPTYCRRCRVKDGAVSYP